MLPGGFSILGIYVLNTQDARRSLEQSADHLFALPAPRDPHGECFAFHLNTSTNKKTCWQFRHGSKSTKPHPCELKWLKSEPKFQSFHTIMSLNQSIDDIADMVQQCQDDIESNSILARINPTTSEIEIYAPNADVHQASPSRYTLTGAIDTRCYVNVKEKDKEKYAIDFIKQDYIRSLQARVDLMIDMDMADDGKDRVLFPRRIRFQLKNHTIESYTTYIFPQDSVQEMVENAKELLNEQDVVHVQVETIEQFPTATCNGQTSKEAPSAPERTTGNSGHPRIPLPLITMAVILVVLSIVSAYVINR